MPERQLGKEQRSEGRGGGQTSSGVHMGATPGWVWERCHPESRKRSLRVG